MYRYIIRPVLFLLDAEQAHHLTLRLFRLLLRIPMAKQCCRRFFADKMPQRKTNLFGIEFPNPVGLAAGFDKNAEYLHELACLGFGHVEIGTVTPLPQPGNKKPRLFRLTKDEAIINRMGFNNDGVEVIAQRLRHRPAGLIVGANIGKNKNTPNEKAVDDYIRCFLTLFDLVDYFTINVSSPNTPGLRALQEKEPLLHLLQRIQQVNAGMGQQKPILLKIAPDLTPQQLDDIIDIVKSTHINGIIATNTTIDHSGLRTSKHVIKQIGTGGLSGRPLKEKSNNVIRYLYEKSAGSIPIIGVGGIMSGADAFEKKKWGASLVQIYTGLIYRGPALIKEVCLDFMK